MKCELIQPNLLDYSKGLLNRSEAEEIRGHIESCAECAALLEEEVAFDLTLSAVPEELPENDVWALVRASTKPKRYAPAVILRGFAALRMRRVLAVSAAMAGLIGVFYGLIPSVPEPVAYQPETRMSSVAVVPAADEPMATHTDAMIDVIEDMQ